MAGASGWNRSSVRAPRSSSQCPLESNASCGGLLGLLNEVECHHFMQSNGVDLELDAVTALPVRHLFFRYKEMGFTWVFSGWNANADRLACYGNNVPHGSLHHHGVRKIHK